MAINTSKFIQNTKGVFWKIQNICYKMGTEFFNIEEEMKYVVKHKPAKLVTFKMLIRKSLVKSMQY